MRLDESVTLTTRDGLALVARRLSAADAEVLRQFNADLSPPSRRRFLPHAYDPATIAAALARSESGADLLVGLFDGDRMIGYFFLWYYTRRVPLLGIGLVDAYQGRGLGEPMLRLLIDQAQAAGREGVALTTMPDNHRAYALYEKVGFQYHGDVENVTGDGRVVTERAMFYEITPGAAPYDGPHEPPV